MPERLVTSYETSTLVEVELSKTVRLMQQYATAKIRGYFEYDDAKKGKENASVGCGPSLTTRAPPEMLLFMTSLRRQAGRRAPGKSNTRRRNCQVKND